MGIKVFCEGCHKTYNVRNEMAGMRGKCPAGHVISVPAADVSSSPAAAKLVSNQFVSSQVLPEPNESTPRTSQSDVSTSVVRSVDQPSAPIPTQLSPSVGASTDSGSESASVSPAKIARIAPLLFTSLASVLAGLLLSIVLDAFRPQIGLLGIVIAVSILAMVFVMSLVARALFEIVQYNGPQGSRTYDKIRSWSTLGLVFFGGWFFIGGVFLGVESLGPPLGFLTQRGQVVEQRKKTTQQELVKADESKRREEERAFALAAAESRRIDDKRRADEQAAWKQADVVLVNPTHRAIALQYSRAEQKPMVIVLAKAGDGSTTLPLTLAWDSGTPVVGNDPALARRLFDAYEPGESLEIEDIERVERVTKARPIVPLPNELISFQEIGSNQLRFGHLLKDNTETFMYCDLVPKLSAGDLSKEMGLDVPYSIEAVSRKDLVAGTEKKLTDHGLRQDCDFLTYCLYNLLVRLQVEESNVDGLSVRPSIFVDNAGIESSVHDQLLDSMQSQMAKAKSDKRAAMSALLNRGEYRYEYTTGLAAILSTLTSHLRDREQELTTRRLTTELQMEYEEEVRRLREDIDLLETLIAASRQVTRNIRTKLVQAGVVVVERSEKARGLYSKIDGEKWLRASAEVAIEDGLVQATHLLMSDLDKPAANGDCHLSLRLVEVRSGRIIWADNGDCKHFVTPRTNQTTSSNSVQLAGMWKCPTDGMTIRIEENDRDIHISLVSYEPMLASESSIPNLQTKKKKTGNGYGRAMYGEAMYGEAMYGEVSNSTEPLRALEFFGRRVGGKVEAKSCYVVFGDDPKGEQVSTGAALEVLDNSHLELAAQRVYWRQTSRSSPKKYYREPTYTKKVFERIVSEAEDGSEAGDIQISQAPQVEIGMETGRKK